MEETGQHRYPEPKERDLSDEEKARLRERIEGGEGDVYRLAREFNCSSSQVAA